MDAALSEALRRGNPVAFFDVSIGGAPVGRLRLELFKKDCPRTVENFRQACCNEWLAEAKDGRMERWLTSDLCCVGTRG
jgi:hypothetical protein